MQQENQKQKPKSKIMLIAIVVVAVLVIAGVIVYYYKGKEETPIEPNAVYISNYAFRSDTITVENGTTITWTNKDNVGHSVVADDGSFTSPILSNGQTWSFTFNKVGTFTYYCKPHPYMKGNITVVE